MEPPLTWIVTCWQQGFMAWWGLYQILQGSISNITSSYDVNSGTPESLLPYPMKGKNIWTDLMDMHLSPALNVDMICYLSVMLNSSNQMHLVTIIKDLWFITALSMVGGNTFHIRSSQHTCDTVYQCSHNFWNYAYKSWHFHDINIWCYHWQLP